MKHVIGLTSKLGLILFLLMGIFSCQKELKTGPIADKLLQSNAAVHDNGHLQQTKIFPSDVAQKWQDLQLRILRLPAGPNPFGLNGNRWFAYIGVALYESVVGGMPAYQSLHGQLTDMPEMPSTEPGKAYHWAASANAALAFLNKNFYSSVATSFKLAMDSLENALNNEYKQQTTPEIFQRSIDFGKEVARRILEWSNADGALAVYPTFVPPVGPGIWSPTPPNPTAMAGPYWGKNRLFVQGSLDNTSSAPPPPYSTDPHSAYYAMVKEVYDVSQTLTQQEKATALYFNDNPGFQAGTHYISIFSQVMQKENPQLDFYAIAAAKTGIALAEAQIGCWKIKYDLLVERPIRYIRDVLGHSTWSPLIPTHPHPEFPSGHSQTGGAFAAAMTNVFGDNYEFTIHTYDNLGMAPRTYHSFFELANDVARSRVLGGIHYSYTCAESTKQGARIVTNILNRVKFQKE